MTDPRGTTKIPIADAGTRTPVRAFEIEGGEYTFRASGSTIVPPIESPAATRAAGGRFSRFGSFLLPLATAAAFAAPAYEGATARRIFSRSRTQQSQTVMADLLWTLDDWAYSEERVTPEQLMLLGDLLALATSEGLLLDLSE